MLEKIPKSEAVAFCSYVENREKYPFIFAMIEHNLKSAGSGAPSYMIEWDAKKANRTIRNLSK